MGEREEGEGHFLVFKILQSILFVIQIQVPSMPPKNYFEVGMKLEAVDKQNPSVIGVGTVVSINGDIINIEFDGYPGLGYASHYGDRDFFPVGWCAHAKHPLRIPGCFFSVILFDNIIYPNFLYFFS